MTNQPKRPPLIDRLKKRLTANPKVNLVDMNLPLTNGHPTPKLKDILETDVDEKYYLKHEIVEKIIQETDFTKRLVSVSMETGKKQGKE